jgi:ligand-binding SRPBCC domain-containing protein
MRTHELEWRLWLPRPRPEVFSFFSDARNLRLLTPPWIGFEMLTPEPIELREGAALDYRLRLYGVPLRWRSVITAWDPPRSFVDEQGRGPYRYWQHTHVFAEERGGTSCVDRVRYAVFGGAIIGRLVVRRDLERLFAYRRQKLTETFGSVPAALATAHDPG